MINNPAYNQAVSDHADGIYRFALSHTRDRDLSKDIVQDCFEKLWIKRETVDPEKVKSYLFTTAYHLIIDHSRRSKKTQPLDAHALQNGQTTTLYSDANEVLNKAVAILPEAQRAVVMLRDYEGYTYEEIAEITGLTESQVKVYIFRARVFLKNYIKNPQLVI